MRHFFAAAEEISSGALGLKTNFGKTFHLKMLFGQVTFWLNLLPLPGMFGQEFISKVIALTLISW